MPAFRSRCSSVIGQGFIPIASTVGRLQKAGQLARTMTRLHAVPGTNSRVAVDNVVVPGETVEMKLARAKVRGG